MTTKFNSSLLKWVIAVAILSLVLAACDPAGGTSVASTSGITTWLDQPITGAVLPLASFTLRAHARDTSGAGIIEIDFKVNDVLLGSASTDATAPLASGELVWNPSAPGTYHIEAWGVNAAGEKTPSDVATVCVTDASGGGCLGLGQPPVLPPTTQAPTNGGIVQGIVYSDFNGDFNGTDPGEGPLDGVTVTLSGCVTTPQTTVTASDGAFSFTGLPAGTCQVTVAKPGWEIAGVFPASAGYPANAASNPALPTAFSLFMVTDTPGGPQTCEQLKNCTNTPTPQASPTPAPTKAQAQATAAFTATKPQAQATATFTPTVTSIPQAQVSFTADSMNLNAGQCTFLHWNVQFATAVFQDGVGVAGVDQKQVCPSSTTTYTLHVEALSGNVDQTITINVTAPPSDKSGPTINKPSAQPNPSQYGGACASKTTSTTFQASVDDPSGVASVQIFYRYENGGNVGGWNAVSTSNDGSGNYSAAIDNNAGTQAYNQLGGVDGTLTWYVLAQDSVGNPTQSGTQGITLQYCLG
jgi:Carboxypeptidase regulatory-like domain